VQKQLSQIWQMWAVACLSQLVTICTEIVQEFHTLREAAHNFFAHMVSPASPLPLL
jgi:hypothetical protein